MMSSGSNFFECFPLYSHHRFSKTADQRGGVLKRALLIGIDHYEINGLGTCEQDARRLGELLSRHGSGSRSRPKNFDVDMLLSEVDGPVTRLVMLEAVKALLRDPADVALLFFAGHGVFDYSSENAVLVAQDGEEMQTGVSLSEITALAAKSPVTSIVIILDCCQSGAAAEVPGTGMSLLGSGVTILTSADRQQIAQSTKNGGVFTGLLLNALEGSAADVRGQITPAAVYSHIDQSLGAWHQRPIYKANVREFVILREVSPRVEDEILEKLSAWFPSQDYVFALDPSFETDIRPGTEDDFPIETRRVNQAVFRALQRCNRSGLVEPVDVEHMYHAAIEGTGCRLTPLGRYYRDLSKEGRF